MTPQAAADWSRRIAAFLDELEAVQLDMRALHAARREAFRSADAGRLAEAGRSEAGLVDRLKTAVLGRERLLADARRAGHRAATLATLATELDLGPALAKRLSEASDRSQKLQRDAWSQWVTARRGAAVTGEILERIVHRGRTSPTYEERESTTPPTRGGSFLDAAA